MLVVADRGVNPLGGDSRSESSSEGSWTFERDLGRRSALIWRLHEAKIEVEVETTNR